MAQFRPAAPRFVLRYCSPLRWAAALIILITVAVASGILPLHAQANPAAVVDAESAVEPPSDAETRPVPPYTAPDRSAPEQDPASLILTVGGRLLLVLGLVIASAIAWKRLQAAALPGRSGSPEALAVAQTVALAPQRFLHLVTIGPRRLLLSSSPQQVTLIADLSQGIATETGPRAEHVLGAANGDALPPAWQDSSGPRVPRSAWEGTGSRSHVASAARRNAERGARSAELPVGRPATARSRHVAALPSRPEAPAERFEDLVAWVQQTEACQAAAGRPRPAGRKGGARPRAGDSERKTVAGGPSAVAGDGGSADHRPPTTDPAVPRGHESQSQRAPGSFFRVAPREERESRDG